MSGDRVSLEELLGQSVWLRRLAGTLVAGEAAAEDLVQETWLAALRHPPAADRPLRPWLGRVARNLASRFKRSEARRRDNEAGARVAEPALDPSTLTGEVEAQRILAEAVLRLEEPLRAVVVMRYQRGEDSRAIGRQLGVPDGTVRWRLKRALELLREDLDQRHGGERSAWCTAFAALLPRPSPLSLGTSLPSLPTGAWLMSASTKIVLAVTAAIVAAWILVREEEPAVASVEGVSTSVDGPNTAAARPAETSPPEAAERVPLTVAETTPPEPVLAECCVVGRVLDPDGHGLPGARVSARPPRLDGSTLRASVEPAPEARTTTSGEHGLYSLALPASRPFVLSAEHPAFAPNASWEGAFAGERRDLTLFPGSALVVAVRSSGHPCPGAEVRVSMDAPGSTGELWTGAGLTGPDGTIVFSGLPGGEARVEARSGSLRGERRFETDPPKVEQCEVPLHATGRIEGTVLDRQTGQPIAGARVGSPDHGVPEVTTDRRGRYALEGIELGIGLWSLGAAASGYASRFELLSLPPAAPERTLDFVLDAAASVAGRVLDHARRPLAGAQLVFLATLPLEPYTAVTDRAETTTDGGGLFTLAQLRPGVAYRVIALAPGQATGIFACGPFPGGTTIDLAEFVLQPGGSLSGSVPEGTDASLLVRLYWAGDEAGGRSRLETHLDTTRADARGRFGFDGLAPGRYRLTLVEPRARRYGGGGELAQTRVELAPGEDRRGLVFTPGESAIAGTVTGPDGRGVRTCRVSLFALAVPEKELAVAYTDRDGSFRLHMEEAGPFRLAVEDRQFLLESRVLEPMELGSVDLALELGELHTPFAIRGELVLDSGELPPGVYVAFRDLRTGERLQRVAVPEFDGRFTMRNLRDEPYDVEFVDLDGRFEPLSLPSVRPGGEDVVLRLVPRD